MSAKTIQSALPDGIRYHQVQQRSSHNSYANLPIDIRQQVQKSNIHSIEVDLHNDKDGIVDGDWPIYHVGTDPVSNIESFKFFLVLCQEIHGAVPDHEVITVFLDMKDKFDPATNHTADKLDAMINERLPGLVYTPAMLADVNETLVEAAVNEKWMTLDGLKGRFIFVLTGAFITEDDSVLESYVDNGTKAKSRMGFIAPDINDISHIGSRDHVVFYNMEWKDSGLGIHVANNNLISRVFEVNNRGQWEKALDNKVHHVAVDFVDNEKNPQFILEDSNGRPFQSLI
jgi:hypothetical protein